MHRYLILITFSLLVFSGCASMTSEQEASVQDFELDYEKFTLDNGLTLIVHEDHKAPIVAVNLWYHVGSKDEKPGKTGFAHLFEHLMFQGSENYNDEYFGPFEEVGATDMNGTTNQDRTNYFQNVPKSALDLALWMESDRMGHLLGVIDQETLDEQRGVVQNEKRQREDQPYGKVWDLISSNSYPEGHPYSWSVIGSMEDLEAASLEDVREWFKQWYGPNNAVLVVAGDVDTDEVRAKVEKAFGAIPAGPPLTRREAWPAKMSGPKRIKSSERVPQARIYKVWNLPESTAPELAELGVAADILAGGKNSRLYKRLVYDEQIATDVGVYLSSGELGSQLLLIGTAQPDGDLAEIERAMDDELQRFLDDGPASAELDRAKFSSYAGTVRGLERVGGFGGKSDLLAASQVFGGSPNAWLDTLAREQSLTAADVQTAAAEWIDENALTVEVHPFPETKAAEQDIDRSSLPVAGEPPKLTLPKMRRATLSNGLKVILAERHAAPVVRMKLVFDAGFAADDPARPGIASMTMAMLDEGTVDLDALEISDRAETLGASIGAGSSLDDSTVSLSALTVKLEPSLELYADVLRNPAFPTKELERIKQQRLAGIAQEKSRPFGIALRTLPPLLYGEGHAYSQPMTGSGTVESVEAMTRDDLVSFHRQWLRPDNGTLIVVGDTTLDTLIPKLEKTLGDWQPPAAPLVSKNVADVSVATKPQVVIVDKPDAEQSLIIAGQIAPPKNDPRDIEMQVMNAILGGKFTSRLNMNLREDKHWSYGARSLLLDARGPRAFLAYAAVQTDQTGPSMREALKEIREIGSTRPVSLAELEPTRKNLTLKLPGKMETSGGLLGHLTELLRYDLPDDYFDTYVERVNNTAIQDVTDAANAVIKPDALLWIIVGDRTKIEAQIRDLDFGPVRVVEAD